MFLFGATSTLQFLDADLVVALATIVVRVRARESVGFALGAWHSRLAACYGHAHDVLDDVGFLGRDWRRSALSRTAMTAACCQRRFACSWLSALASRLPRRPSRRYNQILVLSSARAVRSESAATTTAADHADELQELLLDGVQSAPPQTQRPNVSRPTVTPRLVFKWRPKFIRRLVRYFKIESYSVTNLFVFIVFYYSKVVSVRYAFKLLCVQPSLSLSDSSIQRSSHYVLL